MAKGVSGRRHAQAVFEIALENNDLEKWQSDLDSISSVLTDSQIVAILENPKLDMGKKREMVQNLLPGLAPVAMNLVYYLVAKNRLKIVPDLFAEYERLLNAHYGRETAEVISAVPISEEEQKRIEEGLSAIVGKEVVLTLKVDPEIKGGLVARIGDKLIDGSVRERLQDLRAALS